MLLLQTVQRMIEIEQDSLGLPSQLAQILEVAASGRSRGGKSGPVSVAGATGWGRTATRPERCQNN
jgi:hypothetical protein